jgi:hypothetical protein
MAPPFDPAAFAAQLKALEDAGAPVEQLITLLRSLNAEQTEQVKNTAAATDQTKLLIQGREAELELIVRSAKAQKDLADARLAAAAASSDEERKVNAKNAAIEAEIELIKAKAEAEPDAATRQAHLDHILRLEEAIRANNEELKEYNKQTEEAEKKTKEFVDTIKSLSKELGGAGEAMFAGEDAGKQFMSAIGGIGKSATEAIQKKLVSSLGAAGPAMAGLVGLAATAGAAILKLAIAMSDASKEIQKTTGVSDEFAKTIVSGFAETRKFGGSLKELTGTAIELSKTFTDFTLINDQAAKSLAVTGTMLGNLGVSSADFAKGIQLSTKALGATTEEAKQTQLNLAAFASSIGVAPSQMAADFASAAPSLAKFGKAGEQTFKRLAITAKSTGIEMGRLMQITEKFDTFEGAAEQAGKLNAALGGNFINAMEMLTETDPAARFEMMSGAIKDAGLSFDDMSYFQRKFYADAMGLQDVSELALALSGNTAALGKEAKMTSADYEEMAKRTETVQDFQKRLNVVFAEMIPIVEPLVELLEGMVDFMGENTDVVRAFGAAFIVLGAGIALASLPITATSAAILALTAGIAGIAYYLFEKQYASNFLQGIEKIALAFGSVAVNILEVLNPFNSMAKMFDAFGNALSGVLGNATEFFRVLSDPGAAENILKIATAIISIPTLKNIEFTASMTALAAANTAAAMANTADMVKAAIMQKASPIVASSNAVNTAIQNNNTTNMNGNAESSKVEISLADGFSDMFSAKVVKSVSSFGQKGLV